MPLPNRSPGSLRYLKARLRILKRPKVWGTAAGLLLAVVLAGDYISHRGQLAPNREGRSPTTDTDVQTDGLLGEPNFQNPATGTDIDSLPVLSSVPGSPTPGGRFIPQDDLERSSSSSAEGGSNAAANGITDGVSAVAVGNGLSLLSPSAASGRNSSSSTPLGPVNFTQSTSPQLSSPTSVSGTQPGYVYGIDGFNPPAIDSRSVSPLQTAVGQYSTHPDPQTSTSSAAIAPFTPVIPSVTGQPAPGQTAGVRSPQSFPGSYSPGQPSSNQNTNPYTLQTSPPPGTTGYTLPSTLNLSPSQNTGSSYTHLVTPQSLPRTSAPAIAPQLVQPANQGQPAFQGLGYGTVGGNANPAYSSNLNSQPAQP